MKDIKQFPTYMWVVLGILFLGLVAMVVNYYGYTTDEITFYCWAGCLITAFLVLVGIGIVAIIRAARSR